MKILVTGLLTYESGKTEFIKSLISTLLNHGFKPGYFKPVAGHDGWYQYETILHSIENKILIGHDAYVIGEIIGFLDKLHVISPLDILTLPIDLVKLGFNTHLYENYMSYTVKKMVIARYTHIRSDISNYRNIYFLCKNTISKISNELSIVLNQLIDSLKNSNSIFVKTNTSVVEKLLDSPYIYNNIDSYINYLKNRDPIIIEGYNDVASPTKGSLLTDYVIVVAPGKAIVYSGEKYRTAVELLSYRGYPWSIRVSRVVDIIGKPLEIFDIPLKTYIDKLNKVFEEIVDFIYKNKEW